MGLQAGGTVAGGDEVPGHAAENVGEVEVREKVIGGGGDWVEGSGEGEEYGEYGGDGEQQVGAGEVVIAVEVEGQRNGSETVGGEESVDGEGAHPSVDVGA